ncbi:hypothetical protein TNCT_616261 [Trichonephila clavata]|uniref:Uncharacterized protein n=1 Tax=Trichonephila clavata TaxID=2740835 RepID=A0A8X6F4C5_TRICU|nr:hypothetical protein TNCT_616261 [Trichonephila clavata]
MYIPKALGSSFSAGEDSGSLSSASTPRSPLTPKVDYNVHFVCFELHFQPRLSVMELCWATTRGGLKKTPLFPAETPLFKLNEWLRKTPRSSMSTFWRKILPAPHNFLGWKVMSLSFCTTS